MKKLAIILLASITTVAFAGGHRYTRGYSRSDGTYVKGHYSSQPNHTKRDNWSTKGNTNPYTGKAGYKRY